MLTAVRIFLSTQTTDRSDKTSSRRVLCKHAYNENIFIPTNRKYRTPGSRPPVACRAQTSICVALLLSLLCCQTELATSTVHTPLTSHLSPFRWPGVDNLGRGTRQIRTLITCSNCWSLATAQWGKLPFYSGKIRERLLAVKTLSCGLAGTQTTPSLLPSSALWE